MWGWNLVALLAIFVESDAAVRFANYYTDGMVLQKNPEQAQIWGYGDSAGTMVDILVDGTQTAHATIGSDRKWSAKLPPMAAGGSHTIEVQSSGSSAKISNVMFGDVWVCSGQSNMEFEFNKVQNYQQDLSRAASMQNIRMLKMAHKTSASDVDEPQIETRWQKPGNDMGTQSFSGLCLLYGMELSAHMPDVPIGLIASSWGGTPIESWSSQTALAKCPANNFNYGSGAEHQRSQLWHGMIAPITKMTIKGAIWYQGESNSEHAAEYKCSFKAMIDDWRDQFNQATDGATDKNFPFGFVQLASWRDQKLQQGFIDIRWSQTYEYGYVPNPSLNNVFMAAAYDLPDFNSPYGGIHPRDKEDIAVRLALAARGVAYGENVNYQGPFPSRFSLNGNQMIIEFDNGNGNLEVKSNDGFEVCCKGSASQECGIYEFKDTRMTSHTQSSVTIDTSVCQGQQVAAVRYVWQETPCQLKQCPIYGKDNSLPANCFKKSGPF